MIDIERVRADTPATVEIAHFNNAGSSLPPTPVLDAVVDYLRVEARRGGYEAQAELADRLDDFYLATAAMLGCDRDEVSFAASASEAWWRAFSSVPLEAGDRVLASQSEFQANAFGLLQARDRGVDIVVVPNGADGVVDLDEFDRLLDERVRLVTLTQVSMSNGAVHPAGEVGRRCQAHGVPFLLDACQAAGQRPLDVDTLGCDFLVYTGRKFMRGPRGTGALYVRSEVRERLGTIPFVDGRSAEWHDDGTWSANGGSATFEWGEQNYAGKVGLAVATRYALTIGLDEIATRVVALADRMRAELAQIAAVTVHDEGQQLCGIVTFTHADQPVEAVGAHLSARAIQVSTPGRRNAQWDIGRRGIDAVVRAGVHYYNTEAEVDRLVDAVRSIR